MNTPHTYYAHSLENRPQTDWETMAQHEERVAWYCRRFGKRMAAAFGPDSETALTKWCEMLGSWHDLGKYSCEFQTYLYKANDLLEELPDIHRAELTGKVDHSTAAAQLAHERFGKLGLVLSSYCHILSNTTQCSISVSYCRASS